MDCLNSRLPFLTCAECVCDINEEILALVGGDEAHAGTGQSADAWNWSLIWLLIGDDDDETAALLELVRGLHRVGLTAAPESETDTVSHIIEGVGGINLF